MFRWFGILLGFISLFLGIIGILLPILPTTPFILLAGYLFFKTSPSLYSYLVSIPYCGGMIESWNKYGTISRKAKVLAVISLVLVSVFIWFRHLFFWVKVVISLVFVVVGVYIVTRPVRVYPNSIEQGRREL